jgi:hypothetical protein
VTVPLHSKISFTKMVDDLRWIATHICQIQGVPLWWLLHVVVVTSDVALTKGGVASSQRGSLQCRDLTQQWSSV